MDCFKCKKKTPFRDDLLVYYCPKMMMYFALYDWGNMVQCPCQNFIIRREIQLRKEKR